ncbi:MAG: hypothetical protein AB1938_08550 [Myxococcota bacterium]
MTLNIRLGPEEERLVKGLRKARVNVSELVRRALRDAADRQSRTPADARALMQEIIEDFPSPRRGKRRRPPVNDRKAVREWIRKRLKSEAR